MASAILFSPYETITVTTPFQVVKIKRAWTDAWSIVPWITAQNGSDGSAKGPNDMTFEWRFGNIIQPGTWVTESTPWLNIAGCYIALDVYDQWGGAGLWIGRVDEHAISPFASATVSAGIQTFKAIGLKQELYHKPILGSYAQCYAGVAMTDEVIPFNSTDKDEKTSGIKGANMSPTPNADGVYNFFSSTGADAALNWTHARCIDYLLYYFCNGEAVGGYDGPHYYLSGPTGLYDELDSLIGTFKLDESVGVALDQLINEKRGMSWRIRTDGGPGAPVWIDVFSFFADLNPDWAVIDTFDPTMMPQITFDRTHSYDWVYVQGGPISVCATFSPGYVGNGFCPLLPQWAAGVQADYEGIATPLDEADAQRGAEYFKSVYQRFEVPADWDWYNGVFNAAPYPDDYAGATPAYQSPQFMGSLRFQREIPFYEETYSASSLELRKAFVLAYALDAEGKGPCYHYVEKLSKAGLNPASLSLSDDSLGIIVEPHLPHVAALNTFVGTNTEYEPQYDFYDYLFTGMIKTNARLHVKLPVYNTTIANEVPHVKVIEAPDAELILIAPLTVIDIDPTAPSGVVQTAAGTLASVFRDDSQRLIDNAELAAKFYSQQQAVARIVFKGILYSFWPGGIIDGVFTIEGYTAVGTVVISRQWDFEANTTTITTGFYDIEADKGKSDRRSGTLGNMWSPNMSVNWNPDFGSQMSVDWNPNRGPQMSTNWNPDRGPQERVNWNPSGDGL